MRVEIVSEVGGWKEGEVKNFSTECGDSPSYSQNGILFSAKTVRYYDTVPDLLLLRFAISVCPG